jgi:hypothetical protein
MIGDFHMRYGCITAIRRYHLAVMTYDKPI